MKMVKVTTLEYDEDTSVWVQVSSIEGSPKVMASALRAQADELDPKPADPLQQKGKEIGEQLVLNMFKDMGWKP